MIRGRNVALVLLAVAAFAGLRVALAGYGTVQLGTDARPDYQRPANRQTLSSDYGFNYFNKNGTGPDTCATLGTNGDGSNLIAKEAYAFPENPEIIRPTFFGTNVVQMDGRTGECLYDIRGCYTGGTGTGGGNGKNWESELDSNQQPHLIIYIEQAYNIDDDAFDCGGSISVIKVESRNCSGSVQFTLTQQGISNTNGSITILKSNGVTPEDSGHVYTVSPGSTEPIKARGLTSGFVEITAEPLPGQ